MSEPIELFTHHLGLIATNDLAAVGAALPARGGVYALADREGRVILLAATQSVRRSVLHRLAGAAEGEKSSRRADLAAVTRQIWWTPAFSAFETTWRYYGAARVLYPRDYLKRVAFGPAWFVQVDLQMAYPRFVATSRPLEAGGESWGPFAERRTAAALVQQLEDLFDLCRYHDVLDKSPQGQACAYFEMGRCRGPCDGTVRAAAYRLGVEAARQFAWGEEGAVVERWREEMQQAAGALQFERAGLLKERIAAAGKGRARGHEHARDVRAFRYVVVQRGPGATRVRPFFVRVGEIAEGQTVRLREVEEWVPRWREELAAEAMDVNHDVGAEQLWLVSHFLFRGERTPGVYLHESALSDTKLAAERVRGALSRRAGPKPREKDGGEDA